MRSFAARSVLLGLSALLLAASGCPAYQPKPLRTQLQIREIQTRSFAKVEKNNLVMMKALINVLQDDGFIVKNADKDLGFIVASKETPAQENQWPDWVGLIFSDRGENRYAMSNLTECSVNLSEVGGDFKVRAVFQDKLLDNLGGTMKVRQVEDPVYYQTFFSKVDKSLYLERQRF